jgi:hypothetical protein
VTVHLLPGGTSIVENLSPSSGTGSVAGLSSDDVRELRAWANRELAGGGLTSPAGWAASFDRLAGRFGPRLGRANKVALSAEAASLARHGATSPGGTPFAPDDPVVILTSDTPEGVLAALLNGVALGRPVRYFPRPTVTPPSGVPPYVDAATNQPLAATPGNAAPVDVARIEGLLPDHTSSFTKAVCNLAKVLVETIAAQPEAARHLHLAGGYKTTIPYLTVFAEYLNQAWPLTVSCLHQGDEFSNPRPTPIDVRLRRVNLDRDFHYLRAAAEKKFLTDPGFTDLLGFAYEPAGDGVRLTPLGEGLLAMWHHLPGL